MYDDADVFAYPDRPKVLILSLVEPVETVARVCRIDLQIKGSGLYGLLFIGSQSGKTFGECVGYSKVHFSDASQELPLLTLIFVNVAVTPLANLYIVQPWCRQSADNLAYLEAA